MSETHLYQQIENSLYQELVDGRIKAGEKLPSVRQLSAKLKVSKATVLHALHRLEIKKLIEARPRSGYYVCDSQSKPSHQQKKVVRTAPAPVSVNELLLDIMERSAAFDLTPQLASKASEPGLIELNRAISRAQRLDKNNYHQYYDRPEGLPALREQIALRLQRRGCKIYSDDVCITSGCQNALFLALMATTQPGDVVAVESPGFYGVLQLLEQLNLKVIEIPTSPISGMDIAALADTLKRWPIKACVVSPNFATPSGSSIPTEQRLHLLQLADSYDLAIIEDDIYAETAFSVVPDALKNHDHNNRVILCSSLSKSLSRDIRIGWIIGGRWHSAIIKLKLISQLAGSRGTQQGVADFIASGSYDSHLRRLRKQLNQQRDYLFTECENQNHQISHKPEGGLTGWIKLPDNIDTLSLYSSAMQLNIIITPGSLFSISGEFKQYLRISYAHPWLPKRVAALSSLNELIRAQIPK